MAAPLEQPIANPFLRDEPWTFDEWMALGDTAPNRVELVDGMLVVSPAEATGNARLMLRLAQQLVTAAPPEFEVLPPVNAQLSNDRGLIPDLCVIDTPGFEGPWVPATRFVLVGEIASPSTRVYDRTIKRRLYVDAGIPHLLLVDPRDLSAICYDLQAGEYVEAARSVEGRLTLARPFPVVLDLRPRSRDG